MENNSGGKEYVLETAGLSKKYKDFYAVRNVCIHVEKGDVYGFVGENGAGKTTVIRLITALSLTVKNMAGAIAVTTLLCMALSLTASIFHTVPSLVSSKWMCLIPTYTTYGFLSRGAFSLTEFGRGLLSLLVAGTAVTAAGLIVFTKKDLK
jgi:ABC-type polysaccharide/polyol phosphate transport system ATPase subunit